MVLMIDRIKFFERYESISFSDYSKYLNSDSKYLNSEEPLHPNYVHEKWANFTRDPTVDGKLNVGLFEVGDLEKMADACGLVNRDWTELAPYCFASNFHCLKYLTEEHYKECYYTNQAVCSEMTWPEPSPYVIDLFEKRFPQRQATLNEYQEFKDDLLYGIVWGDVTEEKLLEVKKYLAEIADVN